ncbi:TPA: tail fiber assembly protein, partial [Serratia fonticola]
MSDFSFSDTDQALWLFHFDNKGVFIGSGITIIPKNTGLPANTTTIKCEPQEGFTGIWSGNEWRYVLDNRGRRYWNQYGVGTVVVEIDDVIPDGAIFIEPPKKEPGFVLLYTAGEWVKIKDKTGYKYYDSLGSENIVPSPYFEIPEGATFLAP